MQDVTLNKITGSYETRQYPDGVQRNMNGKYKNEGVRNVDDEQEDCEILDVARDEDYDDCLLPDSASGDGDGIRLVTYSVRCDADCDYENYQVPDAVSRNIQARCEATQCNTRGEYEVLGVDSAVTVDEFQIDNQRRSEHEVLEASPPPRLPKPRNILIQKERLGYQAPASRSLPQLSVHKDTIIIKKQPINYKYRLSVKILAPLCVFTLVALTVMASMYFQLKAERKQGLRRFNNICDVRPRDEIILNLSFRK